jgi:hypothetical protein
MATKKDIDNDITLEIDGELPTPQELCRAIASFCALLNKANKVSGNSKRITWGCQVKKSSNLVGFIPQSPTNDFAIPISIIENGVNSLDKYGDIIPENFNESMIKNIEELAKTATNGKIVNIWLNKKKIPITEQVKNNTNLILHGKFSEYGSVYGRLQELFGHNPKAFTIISSLDESKIHCNITDEYLKTAYELFGKRVEAEGIVKYTSRGIPYEITVDSLRPILKDNIEPNYRDFVGILKDYYE